MRKQKKNRHREKVLPHLSPLERKIYKILAATYAHNQYHDFILPSPLLAKKGGISEPHLKHIIRRLIRKKVIQKHYLYDAETGGIMYMAGYTYSIPHLPKNYEYRTKPDPPTI